MFTRYTNSSTANLAGLYTGVSALTATNALAAASSIRGTVGVQHGWQLRVDDSHKYGIIPGFKQIDGFTGIMLFSYFIKSMKKAFGDFLANRRLELWRMAKYF